LPLSKEQKAEIIASIRRFFSEKLDSELSEIQAGFLLDYFFKEIAPFAYDQVSQTPRSTCFERVKTCWEPGFKSR
jgi:uncharacterized protein (DUF2164 family)